MKLYITLCIIATLNRFLICHIVEMGDVSFKRVSMRLKIIKMNFKNLLYLMVMLLQNRDALGMHRAICNSYIADKRGFVQIIPPNWGLSYQFDWHAINRSRR